MASEILLDKDPNLCMIVPYTVTRLAGEAIGGLTHTCDPIASQASAAEPQLITLRKKIKQFRAKNNLIYGGNPVSRMTETGCEVKSN